MKSPDILVRMSYTDRSASWRTSTLHSRYCAPRSTGGDCTQCPPGPTGQIGPTGPAGGGGGGATGPTGPAGSGSAATWSQYAATRDVSFGCFQLRDVSGINFCDGTYIGHGASFDISSGERIDITSNSNVLIKNAADTSRINCGDDGFGNQRVEITANSNLNRLTQYDKQTWIGGDASMSAPATIKFYDDTTAQQVDVVYYDVGAGRPSLQATGHFLGTAIGANSGFSIGHDAFGTMTNCAFGNDGLPTRISHSQTALASDYIELSPTTGINITTSGTNPIYLTPATNEVIISAGSAPSLQLYDSGISTFGNIEYSTTALKVSNTNGVVNLTSSTNIELDATVIDFKNTLMNSGTAHNVDVKANTNGLQITDYLKVKYNGNDIWIPYLRTDPSA